MNTTITPPKKHLSEEAFRYIIKQGALRIGAGSIAIGMAYWIWSNETGMLIYVAILPLLGGVIEIKRKIKPQFDVQMNC